MRDLSTRSIYTWASLCVIGETCGIEAPMKGMIIRLPICTDEKMGERQRSVDDVGDPTRVVSREQI